MSGTPPKSTGAALVVGGGVAGIQCSLDLAEGGYKVYLVEKAPALGGHMAQLDKTFPTNDCSMCTLAPKLVEAGRHLNIEIVTNSELIGLEGEPGNFNAKVYHHARFVDPDNCTSCGECAPVCPVTVADDYNEGLGERKAIYKLYPQAIPNTYAVDQEGLQPLQARLPRAHLRAGLRRPHRRGPLRRGLQRRQRAQPLPRRLRPHLHAQVRDRLHARRGRGADRHRRPQALRRRLRRANVPLPEKAAVTFKEKVADRRRRPRGLTAARDLALFGYGDHRLRGKPGPGGMLRVGIPEYRLPKAALQRDIDRISALGVDLQLQQGRRHGLHRRRPHGVADGYKAVFLAAGLQGGRTLPVPGADAKGVLDAVEFLLRPPRSARRSTWARASSSSAAATWPSTPAAPPSASAPRRSPSPASRTTRACRPPRRDRGGPRRGHQLQLLVHAVADRHRRHGRASKVEFLACTLGEPDERGWRPPVPIAGSEHELDCDTVIFAIGQAWSTTSSRAPTASRSRRARSSPTRPRSAPARRACSPAATPRPAPLDGHRGHRRRPPRRAQHPQLPARRGPRPRRGRRHGRGQARGRRPRARPPSWRACPCRTCPARRARSPGTRSTPGFTEEQAVAEAKRCLDCAVCSECMECVRACGPGALLHGERDKEIDVEVGAVVMATGFDLYDPGAKSEYGYGRYPNVLSALEYERMLSASGPTIGDVKRPSATARTPRRSPSSSASARATRSTSTAPASAACSPTSRRCSPSTTSPTASPTVFLMDMRAQGKGFDAFYQRALDKGVSFIRSRPSYIKEDPLTKDLLISWEDEGGKLHESALRHGGALGRPGACAQGAGGGRPRSASPSTATASASCTSSSRSRPAARASSSSARSASPRTSPTRSPRPRPRRPR